MQKNAGRAFLLCLLVSTSLVTTASATADTAVQSAAQEWQVWVDGYDQHLHAEDGWLSLEGLYWLREGSNTLGSAADNDHRFPTGTPARFGTIVLSGEQITFSRASQHIRIDGADIDHQILLENESQVSLGTYTFFIIKRERGYAVRLKNSANPAIASFTGPDFYPFAKSWQIPARLVKHQTPQKISIATVYATVRENDSAGWLEFEVEGETIRLQAVSYGPEEPMAIMFSDPTRLSTTYGAGRFLNVEWPREGDMTVIDFNRAYNPPCAITEFATCPLPPPQNRMEIAVEAGELFDQHY